MKHTERDKCDFVNLSESGAVALLLYSRNYMKDGKVCRHDDEKIVKTVLDGGVAMVPTRFFSNVLAKDAAPYLADEKNIRGIAYLPLENTARSLGYEVKSYYEKRLFIVGSKEHIKVMDENPALEEAGAYAVCGDYDATSFTSEDYKAARKAWREELVGSVEYNDMSDPAIREKVSIVTSYAKKLWEKMNKGADREILWGDGKPTASSQLGVQYANIAAMARAWGMYGGELYQNEDLKRDIVDAIEWMYNNMYGIAEVEGRGWRSPLDYNWWDWYIPSPTHMTEVFFIMEDCFTLEERNKYLYLFKWFSTKRRVGFTRENAHSNVGVFTRVAIATEDAQMLQYANEASDLLLELSERDEGPRVDYAQWTHGMAYNNCYGVMNLERNLYVLSCLAGTPLEYISPKIYNMFLIGKYMYPPVMRCGRSFVMMMGRQKSVAEDYNGATICYQLLRLYGMFGEEEDREISDIIKRHTKDPEVLRQIKAQGTIKTCVTLNRILNDRRDADEYVYAHSYYTADKAVQHRAGYAFAVSLSSSRAPAFESVNFNNQNGWYDGDGVTYLYTDYDLDAYSSKNYTLVNDELAHRRSGTTEDERVRLKRSVGWQSRYYPTNDFAGSMQIEDKYILASMQFHSLNVESEEYKEYIDGYTLPVHKNDLVAKKSYFCFDDEIVCLGAGINSTMNSPVNTTAEHRRIVKKEEYSHYVYENFNREKIEENFDKTYTGAVSVLMQGHAGFIFADDSNVRVRRYMCDSAEQEYFELSVRHGKNPNGATYAYVILPLADEDKLARYRICPDVEIVENNGIVQAVREKTLGITSYVFHEGGKCEKITSSIPALVTVIERDGEYTVMVCDPTHKAKVAEFEISTPMTLFERKGRITAASDGVKTVIKVDFTDANGRTYRAVFGKREI